MSYHLQYRLQQHHVWQRMGGGRTIWFLNCSPCVATAQKRLAGFAWRLLLKLRGRSVEMTSLCLVWTPATSPEDCPSLNVSIICLSVSNVARASGSLRSESFFTIPNAASMLHIPVFNTPEGVHKKRPWNCCSSWLGWNVCSSSKRHQLLSNGIASSSKTMVVPRQCPLRRAR